MMKKLKVYGGLTFENGKQVRTICATTSLTALARHLDTPYHRIKDYWCETGNAIELAVALSKPETVFVADCQFGKEFKEYKNEI